MDEKFKELIDTMCLLKPQKSLVSESLFEILLSEANRAIILDKDYDRSYDIYLVMKEICLNGNINLTNFLPTSFDNLKNMSNDFKETLFPIIGNFLSKNLHRLKTDDFIFVGVLKNVYDLYDAKNDDVLKINELFDEYSTRVQTYFTESESKKVMKLNDNKNNDLYESDDSNDSDLSDSDVE
ncbi:MAG: hypothetical protein Terrestrivirus5_149 [Terrestrivirus sp.]|uniref:Uncharacterized protein n=1 Tax=Terrestrivirus sp. TaxID=2487775 RepID=A0A3G4ZN73_9VIRU|nr:MAG: hypothetical protein Terrestrivirus5_149 [Terrestrivirus sp.]